MDILRLVEHVRGLVGNREPYESLEVHLALLAKLTREEQAHIERLEAEVVRLVSELAWIATAGVRAYSIPDFVGDEHATTCFEGSEGPSDGLNGSMKGKGSDDG